MCGGDGHVRLRYEEPSGHTEVDDPLRSASLFLFPAGQVHHDVLADATNFLDGAAGERGGNFFRGRAEWFRF